MDRPGRGVSGLPGEGSRKAGDNQLLPTGPPVLAGKPEDEGSGFGSGERIGNTVKVEVPIGPHRYQIPSLHEPFDLPRALQISKIMLLGGPLLAIQ